VLPTTFRPYQASDVDVEVALAGTVESARKRGIAESINESLEKQVRYLQGRVAESDVNKIFTFREAGPERPASPASAGKYLRTVSGPCQAQRRSAADEVRARGGTGARAPLRSGTFGPWRSAVGGPPTLPPSRRPLSEFRLGQKYDGSKSRAAEEAVRAGTSATTPHVTTSKQASL
jgi:hypothetical protein